MEKIFQELMSVKDVYGVWLVDAAGQVRYRKTGGPEAGGEPTD